MITSILQLMKIVPRKVPLSELRARSCDLADQGTDPEGDDLMRSDGLDLMVTLHVLEEYAIPYERFVLSTYVNRHLEPESSWRVLPDNVPVNVEPGVIVAMDGEEWVVVECNAKAWIALANARYIDITK